MSEKYKYFLEIYRETHNQREKYKKQFFDLAKTAPIFTGATYFFYKSRNIDISFSGTGVDLFNLIILINAILLIIFSFGVLIGYLRPPVYHYLSTPKELLKYWEVFENRKNDYPKEPDAQIAFEQNQINTIVNYAEHNNSTNLKLNQYKNRCANLLLAILGSYIVLLIILVFR